MNLNEVTQEQMEELFENWNLYPEVRKDEMYPLSTRLVDMQDYSKFKMLTCVNHPYSVFYTRNPWTREIYMVQSFRGIDAIVDEEQCPCGVPCMRVVIRKEKKHVRYKR